MESLNDAKKHEIVDMHLREVLSLMPAEDAQAKGVFYKMLMDNIKNDGASDAQILRESAAFHDKSLSELVTRFNIIVPPHLQYSFSEKKRSRRAAETSVEMKTFPLYDFDNHLDTPTFLENGYLESLEKESREENISDDFEVKEDNLVQENLNKTLDDPIEHDEVAGLTNSSIINNPEEVSLEEDSLKESDNFTKESEPVENKQVSDSTEIVQEDLPLKRGRRAKENVEFDQIPEKTKSEATDEIQQDAQIKNVENIPLTYRSILSKEFAFERKGYNPDDVDDFLERLLLNFKNVSPNTKKFDNLLNTLKNREFKRNSFFKGYAIKEVDNFINEIYGQFLDEGKKAKLKD